MKAIWLCEFMRSSEIIKLITILIILHVRLHFYDNHYNNSNITWVIKSYKNFTIFWEKIRHVMGIIDWSINDIKYYWVGFNTSKKVNKMVIWLNGLVLGLDLETGARVRGLDMWFDFRLLGLGFGFNTWIYV
jgi:hypothetical protein